MRVRRATWCIWLVKVCPVRGVNLLLCVLQVGGWSAPEPDLPQQLLDFRAYLQEAVEELHARRVRRGQNGVWKLSNVIETVKKSFSRPVTKPDARGTIGGDTRPVETAVGVTLWPLIRN